MAKLTSGEVWSECSNSASQVEKSSNFMACVFFGSRFFSILPHKSATSFIKSLNFILPSVLPSAPNDPLTNGSQAAAKRLLYDPNPVSQSVKNVITVLTAAKLSTWLFCIKYITVNCLNERFDFSNISVLCFLHQGLQFLNPVLPSVLYRREMSIIAFVVGKNKKERNLDG